MEKLFELEKVYFKKQKSQRLKRIEPKRSQTVRKPISYTILNECNYFLLENPNNFPTISSDGKYIPLDFPHFFTFSE